jgi:arginase family enzyme
MLGNNIRILDLDGAVARQKGLVSKYQAQVVSLADIGPHARFWLNKKTRLQIEKRLKNSGQNALTFLGSGDFHHLTYLLASQFQEPFTLIVFDHHPDWDIMPPRLGCASWVSAVLDKPQIKKCLLLGVSSEDISSPAIQTGDLSVLRDDRLEIYPYYHVETKVFFKKVPENISIEKRAGIFSSTIYWNEFKNKDIGIFFKNILSHIPTDKVYLSIDKDCLQSPYAATNWEEGLMSLDDLLFMLKMIKKEKDIIAADIAGDYSPVLIDGWLKKRYAELDRPKKTSSIGRKAEEILRINESTNLKIVQALIDG